VKENKLINNKFKIKLKEQLLLQNGIINLKEWMKTNLSGQEINQKLKKINIMIFINLFSKTHQTL
jgi:hypothetical protein